MFVEINFLLEKLFLQDSDQLLYWLFNSHTTYR